MSETRAELRRLAEAAAGHVAANPKAILEVLDENAALRARAEAAEASRDAALERLAEAERLLRPFAYASASVDSPTPDRADIWESPAAMEIFAGDLRAARSFLQEAKP